MPDSTGNAGENIESPKSFKHSSKNPLWVPNATKTESIVTGKVGDEHQSHQKPNSKLSKQNEGILPIKKPQRMRGVD